MLLVIDGNNLGYRIWSSFVEKGGHGLSNSLGQPTTVIYGMLRALETFAKSNKVDKTVVCWDLPGGSAWRKGLFKHYKANRVYKDMQPYFDELDACRCYLTGFGIPQMQCKGIEADDVIAFVARDSIAENGKKTIVFSDDKDYYQLLTPSVSIWRPCVEKFYTIENFREEYSIEGFQPKHLALVDALTGRDKDNIPGACELDKNGVMQKYGFGPAKAIGLAVAGGYRLANLHALLKAADGKGGPVGGAALNQKFITQLLAKWEQVKVSYLLSRLRYKKKWYTSKELELMLSQYENAVNNPTLVRRTNILQLMENLEVRTLNILPLLVNIGVKLDGKAKDTAVRIKT
jgi:5'-3' exonuclease